MKETYTSIFPVKQEIHRGMSWQEINLLPWQEVNQLDWFRILKSIKYIIELASEFVQKVEYLSTFKVIEDLKLLKNTQVNLRKNFLYSPNLSRKKFSL
jgi:hypothetical protein